MKIPRILITATLLIAFASLASAATNPFVGRWALTLPAGNAGWLGISEEQGQYKGQILWGGGSVVPVTSTKIEGDKLVVTRVEAGRKASGKTPAREEVTETITATLKGDVMQLSTVKTRKNGKTFGAATFTGKRIPDLPPKPELSKVKFGAPIVLFNGKDLSGWRLINPQQENGWSVKDGILMNRPVQVEGKPHKRYGNLRTDAEFEDFNLRLEARTLEKSNSGVYLRGIYEIQVMESYGKPLDPHNMGALYSRITPSVAAEKPVGEWQTMDITLVDRHLTVILNGKTIIDNQPVLGCTGGAMTSDESKPGPLFLQGDHSNIDYRNIVLRRVVK